MTNVLKAQIIEDYVANGMTTEELARKYELSKTTTLEVVSIYTRPIEKDITLKSAVNIDALTYMSQNWHIMKHSQLAKILNYTPAVIEYMSTKHGLEKKTMVRAKANVYGRKKVGRYDGRVWCSVTELSRDLELSMQSTRYLCLNSGTYFYC